MTAPHETPVHYGPPHDSGCLAVHAREARCACARRDWLREMVPRRQAREELLAQLAGWAHEQGIFAENNLEREAPTEGAPRWARYAVQQAARMAREIYIGMRMRALAMQEECKSAAVVQLKAKRPVETVEVQETLL